MNSYRRSLLQSHLVPFPSCSEIVAENCQFYYHVYLMPRRGDTLGLSPIGSKTRMMGLPGWKKFDDIII